MLPRTIFFMLDCHTKWDVYFKLFFDFENVIFYHMELRMNHIKEF